MENFDAHIEDFRNRLEFLKEESEESQAIIAFPEIRITEEQLQVIADPMFGFTKENLQDYYRRKIHGNLLLSVTSFTTGEDQPDFQYLFDLGVQALASGMVLENITDL